MAPTYPLTVKKTSAEWSRQYRLRLVPEVGGGFENCDFEKDRIYLIEFAGEPVSYSHRKGRLFACSVVPSVRVRPSVIQDLENLYHDIRTRFGYDEWRHCPDKFRRFLSMLTPQ